MLSKDVLAKDISLVKAVYYYGDACPLSFWDSLRRDKVDEYFPRIKNDGFNTVIFLIPVGVVELKRTGSPYYESFIDNLNFMIRKCHEHGLFYVFRLFFVWDSFPGKFNRLALTYEIYNRQSFEAYKDVAGELYALARPSSLFLFGFITWEDMTPQLIMALPGQPYEKRKQAGELISIAQEYSEDGAIPAKESSIYASYLSYIDSRFVDVMAKLQEVFPPLTAEVRIDFTPIPLPGGHFGMHVHEKQYALPGNIDVIGTYYAPYMGAKNEGDNINAEFAFDRFLLSQAKAMEVSGAKVFIDQLLVYIGQEKFNHFSRMPNNEIKKFLFNRLLGWLRENGIGYANWSFQDYILSATSNACFKLADMDGWHVTGNVQKTDDGLVSMVAPASIKQQRLTRPVKKAYVVLEFESIDDACISVELGDDERITLDYSGRTVRNEIVRRTIEVPVSRFLVATERGSCVMRRCFLGWDYHSNGGYDLEFNPGNISAMLATFNQMLELAGR